MLINHLKTCSKCRVEKPKGEFTKKRTAKDELDPQCKGCRKIIHKEYYEHNKEKIAKEFKEYYQANREKKLKYAKAYRESHKEGIAEFKRIYNETNKEKVSRANKRWKGANPEKVRLYNKIRKGKKRAISNTLIEVTREEVNQLIGGSNNACFWCDEDILKGEMHLDHIYPLSKGGGHTISNLCISCRSCNLRKSNKDPEKWLEEILC